MLDLVTHLVVAYRTPVALHAETGRARERDLRTHLDVELERERLPFVEMNVLDARLSGGLNLLALENFLVRLVEEAVERLAN